jgi:2-oxoglutarate ferredoxin oxidoreductase subunit beta
MTDNRSAGGEPGAPATGREETAHKAVTSFMAESCSLPFCKGCGHGHVLRKLNDAMVKLRLDPGKVSLVTDIGCIGLADSLFALPHTVHTTHGRSTAFATGIELADGVLGDSRLKTIVMIGDGGAMIGLLHLVNAALLNVDVTVLLCNNYLFGMTGGQNSAFSPLDFITSTTPDGNMIPPLDICGLMVGSNAGFVARKLATDHDLGDTIADAIAHPGFSLVEVVELCTEFGARRNQLSGTVLKGIVESHGQRLGLLTTRAGRGEFGGVYRKKFPPDGEKAGGRGDGFILRKYRSTLGRRIGIVIGGSAGEKVQSAAATFCEGAAMSGLYSSQKNDNPVTQGTGFSLAEVCVAPAEIDYTGIDSPDAVIVTSEAGARQLVSGNVFGRCRPDTIIVCDTEIGIPDSPGEIVRIPLRKTFSPARAALGALAVVLEKLELYPSEAFFEGIRLRDADLAGVIEKKSRSFTGSG